MSRWYCWRNHEDYTTVQGGESHHYKCRWKFCLLVTCGITAAVLLIVLCILFLSVVPAAVKVTFLNFCVKKKKKKVDINKLAAGENSVLTQKRLVIFNVTESSVQINATLQLAGTGPYPATIPAVVATVYNEFGAFGTLDLPQIDLEANKGATVNAISTLRVTNKQVFD
ncbi:hypothetical protein RFI_31804, partial [Reticulomyxa filosa]